MTEPSLTEGTEVLSGVAIAGQLHWVPIEGMGTEAGPVVGALISAEGGPVFVFDMDKGQVRPIKEEELGAPAPSDADSSREYYVISRRTGQPGRMAYTSPVMGQLALTTRPDHEDYQLGVKENGELRLLTPEERQYVNRFLVEVGLEERATA